MSALFNTSVENAMEKLQSGLFSGNVRPLRSYGIDISQNQIDALFETNQALASLGVNARNLSQSDKVLARLIITLRDGSNAFGTMNREINTLQSQIRILQGSFSNFKLAIGDLVQEPLRQSLVYVNGFIIAMTNIIRLFKPLKTTDENNVFTSTAMGAEEANEAVDKLNGKLADFDKFNVLGGQSQGGSQLAVTEALTAELEKQQKLYQEQVEAMSKVKNEAKVLSEDILKWFVVLDENGKFVDFTNNAKELGANISAIAGALGSLKLAQITASFATLGATLKTTFSLKNLPIMAIVASLAYMYTTNEDFRKSVNNLASTVGNSLLPILDTFVGLLDTVAPIVTPIIQGVAELVAGTINLANNLGILEPAIYAIISIGITKKITGFQGSIFSLIKSITGLSMETIPLFARKLMALKTIQLGGVENALKTAKFAAIGFGVGLASSFGILTSVINDLEGSQKSIVSWCSVVFGALGTVLGVILAIKGGMKGGIIGASIAGLGVGAILAGIKGLASKENDLSFSAHADGGYSNANLIMTHENGNREWVGKAAGSSAIVNDTQMSDIMESAVAKGVYRALSSSRTDGSSGGTTKNIYNFQVNGRTLLSVMEDEARKQGKTLARI